METLARQNDTRISTLELAQILTFYSSCLIVTYHGSVFLLHFLPVKESLALGIIPTPPVNKWKSSNSSEIIGRYLQYLL